MNTDWEILLETAHRETPAQEFGHPPMRNERKLKDAVAETELAGLLAELLLHSWRALRQHDEPDVAPGTLETMHRAEKGKGSLAFAKLAIASEVRAPRHKLAPHELSEVRIAGDVIAQRVEIESWALGREQLLGYREITARRDAVSRHAVRDGAFGDRANSDHGLGRPQHVVVKRLELRVMPKPSRIAARHAGDMRHAHDLSGEMAGDAIGLQIVRMDDIKRRLRVDAGGDAGELGHERARHRNVGLRPVDGIRPVHHH